MLKVSFVITSMNTKGGGAEKVLATIFNMLSEQRQDLECKLYTIDNTFDFFYKINNAESVTLLGADAGLFSKYKSYYKLIRNLILESPDYVIAFNISSYAPLSLICLFNKNIKLIASEHSTYDAIKSSFIKRILLRASDRYIFKYTVLSNRVCNSFPVFFQKKSFVIPNPVCIPSVLPETSYEYIFDYFKIISVGRLTKEKNHSILIKAFQQVLQNFPIARLYIYGDGELKSELVLLISDLGLKESVFLIPSTCDLNSIYFDASLFCLPSLYEGFGLAAAEAVSYGIPVIGFDDCLGLHEFIINNENGFLLKRRENSIEDLSFAIIRLLNNSSEYKRLKKNCILPDIYKPSYICQRWLSLFDQIK